MQVLLYQLPVCFTRCAKASHSEVKRVFIYAVVFLRIWEQQQDFVHTCVFSSLRPMLLFLCYSVGASIFSYFFIFVTYCDISEKSIHNVINKLYFPMKCNVWEPGYLGYYSD